MSTDLPLVPLAELATVNPPVSTGHLEPDNIVSFIPMIDVTETGHWVRPQVRKLREVRNGYTPFQEGDILFAKITPCMENGKGAHAIGLVNKVGFGTTEFHVLRAKPFTDARFIYHCLQSEELRLRAKAMMTGSAGQQRVPAEFFEHFKVPFLPLVEQQRIAEILDTLDIQIQETERLIAKLRQQKIGLLHGLLTRGIDEYGELRDPVAHPEQFKDSVLGRIPREWEISNVGQLGLWRGGSTPSKLLEHNWAEGSILWISPKDVQSTEIVDSQDKITQKALSTYKLNLFEANDIIVVFRSGILRHTFPVAIGKVPFTVNQDMKVLSPKSGIHYEFAHFVLQSLGSKVLKVAVKAGTTVESVDLRTFLDLPILLPSEQEQYKIVLVLETHDTRIHTEETHLSKLKQIKKGLMHDLLTGRVRVTGSH
jgi:type I restriction enzyme S subunit